MLIRSLEPADVESCIELGRLLHQESPTYSRFSFNEKRLYSLAETCLNHPDYCCFIAEDSDSNIVGMMIGVTGNHFFSDYKYAADLTLFVKPENRGSSAALRLITAFCIWAEAIGCDEIRCGITTGIKTEISGRIYKKFGFNEEGNLYVKVIPKSQSVH